MSLYSNAGRRTKQVPCRPAKPRVRESLLGGQPLLRVHHEELGDEVFRVGRDVLKQHVGHVVLSAHDLRADLLCHAVRKKAFNGIRVPGENLCRWYLASCGKTGQSTIRSETVSGAASTPHPATRPCSCQDPVDSPLCRPQHERQRVTIAATRLPTHRIQARRTARPTCASPFPQKGGAPETIIYAITPMLHMSHLGPYDPCKTSASNVR